MTITATTDLSGPFGLAREQGRRPTCLAFALSDLNRFHSAAPSILSAEFLYHSAARLVPGWKPGDGLYLTQALAATASPGQPQESMLPYQPHEPTIPLSVLPTYGNMFSSQFLNTKPQAKSIIAGISKGQPVGLIIKITPEFLAPLSGIVNFSKSVYPGQMHAVVATAVGVHSVTNEKYVRIRNSWGSNWGQSGYAWLHSDYIDTHAVSAFGV